MANTKKTEKKLFEMFGDRNSFIDKFSPGNEVVKSQQYVDRYPYGVTCMGDAHGQHITIGCGVSASIQFTIFQYPACCGSQMFHSFAVSPQFTDEQVYELMSTFIEENRFNTFGDVDRGGYPALGKNGRLEVMMVEVGRKVKLDPLTEVEPVENPNIQYKQLWNFFHKYAKRVRTRLEVNRNTGNVLHNMEVIL